MERLILGYLHDQVVSALDPLHFAYRPGIGVDDVIIYLLHRALCHLEAAGGALRIMFFNFSSHFNTIKPWLLRRKMEDVGVDQQLVVWMTKYATNRPGLQAVRLVCSMEAPQGAVLPSFLFSFYISEFRHNSDECHLQKFSDDIAIIGCLCGML